MIEYVLGNADLDDWTYADLNEDSNIDILDVVLLVALIINENGI